MGRIGKSYPRFQSSEQESLTIPPHSAKASALRVLGAIVGLFSALGLVGWLLSR